VLEALTDPSYDGVQFSGHAFYRDGQGDGSGLLCAGRVQLTLADLQERRIGPRFVFFNACQSARVRSDAPDVARALAEYVLRSGVEAYLGTFWVVQDQAAADFAVTVYRELASGKRLDEAVLAARKLLLTRQSADWANYALYGSGAFQLKPR
jgi:CHAT domain-containing protein